MPRGPTNCQYGPGRPRPAVSICFLRIPPTRPAPSCCLRGLVFCILRPDQSSHLSPGEPPATSWIFLVCQSYPALVSINPPVDLRVHCIVHLAQDRFPHRSSGQLRLGKAAKGVALVPSSETKCYAPAERCGVAQYFGQRETRTQQIPQRKDYIINRQNRLKAPGYIARAWAHYNTFRGAPFPRQMS